MLSSHIFYKTLEIQISGWTANINFMSNYRDGDSILDFLDNCPSHANGDQSDVDKDGQG